MLPACKGKNSNNPQNGGPHLRLEEMRTLTNFLSSLSSYGLMVLCATQRPSGPVQCAPSAPSAAHRYLLDGKVYSWYTCFLCQAFLWPVIPILLFTCVFKLMLGVHACLPTIGCTTPTTATPTLSLDSG